MHYFLIFNSYPIREENKMLEEKRVIEVGASKFKQIVGKNTSAVKIIEDNGSMVMKISIFRKGTYQTVIHAYGKDPKRAWMNVFPGKSMPKEKKVRSAEEVRTDRLIRAGAFDEFNNATNFISAR